jgi:hypothetical protein
VDVCQGVWNGKIGTSRLFRDWAEWGAWNVLYCTSDLMLCPSRQCFMSCVRALWALSRACYFFLSLFLVIVFALAVIL